MKWIKVNAKELDEEILKEAAECIHEGGIIVFPTETFYGMGASAVDEDAVKEVFRLKNRPIEKQLTVLIPDFETLEKYTYNIPPLARFLAEKFWPGSLTILLEAKESLLRPLKAHTNKVGFRISSHHVALKLTEMVKLPITATSANLSGSLPVVDPHQLPGTFLKDVNLVIDAGSTPGGAPSTIVDVVDDTLVIIREGTLADEVKRVAELSRHDR